MNTARALREFSLCARLRDFPEDRLNVKLAGNCCRIRSFREAAWTTARRAEKNLERAMGIEPTALAWEARVLPLYDAREAHNSTREGAVSANRAAARMSTRRTKRRSDHEVSQLNGRARDHHQQHLHDHEQQNRREVNAAELRHDTAQRIQKRRGQLVQDRHGRRARIEP